MKRFEYKWVYVSKTEFFNDKNSPNILGKEGWEMFAVVGSENGRTFYYKREIE